MTVTYRAFTHFDEMPLRIQRACTKLVPSVADPMYKILELHRNGYVGDRIVYTTNGPRYYKATYRENVDKQNRSAIVAFYTGYDKATKKFVKNMPVGWCVSDDTRCFQIFVNPEYRGNGIAKHLTGCWLTLNTSWVRRNANHGNRITLTWLSGQLLTVACKNAGINLQNCWGK